MWICLSDAFLSIVHKDCGPDELLVRARRKGDIEKVLGVKATRYTKSDYLYRVVVPRSLVMAAINDAIQSIDYPNFKDSVEDEHLHQAYMSVWIDMANIQIPPPYSGE